MLTDERFKEIVADEDLIKAHLLPDDADLVAIWEKYEEEDRKSICGQGEDSVREINRVNTLLYRQSGIQAQLPYWGSIVEIGSGYGAMRSFISPLHDWYQYDIIKRTPETLVITDYKIPHEDNTVDCAVSVNCFQHITPTNRMKYVWEFHRVLKNNGLCFIMYVNNPSGYVKTGDHIVPMVSNQEYGEWLAVGFRVVSITQRMDGLVGVWMQKFS